ncbi:hypothetical protein CEXT_123441 [Caerostris extrusa]|uniref:Uncharacterized protein n=1 Tax=Caerostris extrusa TaxID=172846 RepID=A0AAV4MQB6_CAEEX|nr:hypothetical protein CEXT_123441 [Caerostris extrusa]
MDREVLTKLEAIADRLKPASGWDFSTLRPNEGQSSRNSIQKFASILVCEIANKHYPPSFPLPIDDREEVIENALIIFSSDGHFILRMQKALPVERRGVEEGPPDTRGYLETGLW